MKETAFPTVHANHDFDGTNCSPGMTLRDYFAAAALTGLIASEGDNVSSEESNVKLAYGFADAMLRARLK